LHGKPGNCSASGRCGRTVGRAGGTVPISSDVFGNHREVFARDYSKAERDESADVVTVGLSETRTPGNWHETGRPEKTNRRVSVRFVKWRSKLTSAFIRPRSPAVEKPTPVNENFPENYSPSGDGRVQVADKNDFWPNDCTRKLPNERL